jgi:hypothetical protein
MRKRGRLDGNHRQVVAELRKLGFSVQSLANLGDGCPDLLVGASNARNYLFELKDPARPPSKRVLTSDEKKWIANWKGPDEKKWIANWKGQVRVVETTEEIVEVINNSYRKAIL